MEEDIDESSDSDYDDEKPLDVDDSSDYDDEDGMSVEVSYKPIKNDRRIEGEKFFGTEIRKSMKNDFLIDTNDFLNSQGFFWNRGRGGGTTGQVGEYVFIPEEMIETFNYNNNKNQYPTLNKSGTAAVGIKVIKSTENTRKEMFINNYLKNFCKNTYKNYFGGTIQCPFLISTELPFSSDQYKFQWSEAMDMDLDSYVEILNKKPRNEFPFDIVNKIMLQLVSGMISLHEASVVHADFKADQCLLNFSILGDTKSINKVLIADFGNSGLLINNNNREIINSLKKKLHFNKTIKKEKLNLSPDIGARGYRPMSRFYQPFYNDIFALGVTFSTILGSYEIEEIVGLYHSRRVNRVVAFNSLNRRISRCLNDVFDKNLKTSSNATTTSSNTTTISNTTTSSNTTSSNYSKENIFEPKTKIEHIYHDVLHLLLDDPNPYIKSKHSSVNNITLVWKNYSNNILHQCLKALKTLVSDENKKNEK